MTDSEWNNLLALSKDEQKQKLLDLIKNGLWLYSELGVKICKALPPHDAYEVMCEYAVRWLGVDDEIQNEFVAFSTEDLLDLVNKMIEVARKNTHFGRPVSSTLQWHMFENWTAELSLPILAELYVHDALDFKLKFIVRKAILLVVIKNFLAASPCPVGEATLKEYLENVTI